MNEAEILDNVKKLNKVYNILPQFIKTVVDRLFNHSDIQLKFFKQQFT